MIDVKIISRKGENKDICSRLLEQEDAKAIYNIDNFISKLSNIKEKKYNNKLKKL